MVVFLSGLRLPMAMGTNDQWEAATIGYQKIAPNYWKGEEGRRALLEGKTPDKPTATGERLVVQVGAFAEASGAREVRQKLERAGLKTYTHVANTAEGQRIRVRVGPFASRAEAEKVAARVKALGLPAAILTL